MATLESVQSRLTPRQIDVVECIRRGLSNRDIAEELQTTEQVVKNQLRAIYDACGVWTRLELAVMGARWDT